MLGLAMDLRALLVSLNISEMYSGPKLFSVSTQSVNWLAANH